MCVFAPLILPFPLPSFPPLCFSGTDRSTTTSYHVYEIHILGVQQLTILLYPVAGRAETAPPPHQKTGVRRRPRAQVPDGCHTRHAPRLKEQNREEERDLTALFCCSTRPGERHRYKFEDHIYHHRSLRHTDRKIDMSGIPTWLRRLKPRNQITKQGAPHGGGRFQSTTWKAEGVREGAAFLIT